VSETREFPLAAVLCVMTGPLLGPIEDVYAILSWMVGRSVFTHEIPAAMRECGPDLLSQFPEMASIDGSQVNRDNYAVLLHGWITEYGATKAVAPLGWNRLAEQSPIDTATEMFGDKLIVIEGGPHA
jgi:hypothetical protein